MTTPAPYVSSTSLTKRAHNIRRHALRMGQVQGQGYVGQALGAADLLAVSYFHAMNYRPEEPEWEQRDRFYLSIGHYAIALYAALIEAEIIPLDELETYGADDSRLPMSGMAAYTPGMEITGGSLGQGLGIAVGACLGLKRKGSPAFVYNLLSDGELNEGSTWEAVMSASHWKLDNLIAIVDVNNLQLDGTIAEVMPTEPIDAKFRALGFDVMTMNGHDMADVLATLMKAKHARNGKPICVLAHTVKGKGVGFMENSLDWHGKAPNDEQYKKAIAELKGAA